MELWTILMWNSGVFILQTHPECLKIYAGRGDKNANFIYFSTCLLAIEKVNCLKKKKQFLFLIFMANTTFRTELFLQAKLNINWIQRANS